jgi:predicted XRE-type DNA-binding protein
MHFPEEIVISSQIKHVRLTRSLNHRTRVISEEFNDSLEVQTDIFKQESVVESATGQWSEWQKHISRSEGSSKESTDTHRESEHISPGSNTYSTGLTPDFDKLNFDIDNSFSFHSGSPIDFSMLLPNEDNHRCSTVTKTVKKMSYDSAYNAIRKDLFSADVVEHVADPISPDELNHLRSETFVKSGSSYCDMNLKYPDMNFEQSLSQQNSDWLEQDSSAQSVIEAGLWVKEARSEKLAKTAVSENVNLDATAESRKCVTSFSMKGQKSKKSKGESAVPLKQTKKPERDESAGVFLEISPPRGHIYDLCGSVTKTQRTSQITGWSKTSVYRRNYPHIDRKQGKN